VYSFDLPFHGETQWHAGEKPLDKDLLQSCIHELFLRLNIEKFSLVAFSIGAKFTLTIIETFPKQIESVTLLAPDGIVTNPWYWLATYPFISRTLFKSMIEKPSWFFTATKWAKKAGFINASVKRFAESQMNTLEKRRQVYYTWVVLRHLKPNRREIATIINTQPIQVTLVAGEFDTMITPKSLNDFILMLSKPEVVILPCKHHQLLTRWIETIR
jgi:pimeloyl-ACP methyl ester carboxylesterase